MVTGNMRVRGYHARMLAARLLALTLFLPPTGQSTTLQLSLSGDFRFLQFTPPPAVMVAGNGRTLEGWGVVGATLFLHPVRDDDAAPSLQPFLQRASALRVEGQGGGFDLARPAPLVGRNGSFGYGRAAAAIYVHRRINLAGGIGVDYQTFTDVGQAPVSILTIPLYAQIGLRLGDALVSLGWSGTPTRLGAGDFSLPFAYGVYAEGYGVVRRRLELGASVGARDQGAGASGSATWWLARRLGVTLSVGGGRGYDSFSHSMRGNAYGGAALTAWITARIAVATGCDFEWYQFGSNDPELGPLVGVSLTVRPL
jgi:hypothetical protein